MTELESTRIHDILRRHIDAAVEEAKASGLNNAEQFAANGMSYLIGGLVMGTPRWSPDKVAGAAKACAQAYTAKLKASHN